MKRKYLTDGVLIGQEYPKREWIANRILPQLTKEQSKAPCYFFPMLDYVYSNGVFLAVRSGPNWEGGVFTLTTCKHLLRTAKTPEEWEGHWLVAFTPRINGENYLLFRARVDKAFPHQFFLGDYLRRRHPHAYKTKLSTRNPRGDIHEPKRRLTSMQEAENIRNYVEPVDHSRFKERYTSGAFKGKRKWNKDIKFRGHSGRPPAAFILGSESIWCSPQYKVTRPLGRSGFLGTVGDLRNIIKAV